MNASFVLAVTIKEETTAASDKTAYNTSPAFDGQNVASPVFMEGGNPPLKLEI